MGKWTLLGVMSLFFVGVLGCASIEATHDHSRTIDKKGLVNEPRTIAIAPVVEIASVEGLSKNLNTAMLTALQTDVYGTRVQGSDKLMASLLANESLIASLVGARPTGKQVF